MTQPRPLPSPLLDDPEVWSDYLGRVMSRIEWPIDAVGCWIWKGQTHHFGHGNIGYKLDGEWTNFMVHRIMYAWWYGDTELPLDHLCRTPSCVNPMHLEPVTQTVNNERSPISLTTINAKKTHCKRGHPFDDENTKIQTRTDGRSYRVCRACEKMHAKRGNDTRRERRRAAKRKNV